MDKMMFIVCEYETPGSDICLARPVQLKADEIFGTDKTDLDRLTEEYEQTCFDYNEWQEQGKEPIAWNSEIEEIKVFV